MSKFHYDKKFKAKRKVKNNPKGKRYVITDIHGYYATFCELLDQIKLKKHDQLFLLGDFIDRGRQGKEVLDKVISLIDEGYAIYPLRGNHEEMLLDFPENRIFHMQSQSCHALGLCSLCRHKLLHDRIAQSWRAQECTMP